MPQSKKPNILILDATFPFALTLTLKLGTGCDVGAGWLVGAGEVGEGATGVG